MGWAILLTATAMMATGSSTNCVLRPAMAADLAVRFTDGFGMQQSPTYVSISRSHYTRGTDAVFPEADFQAPLYVVNQFSATDGTGGTYQNKLHYYAARLHLQGRGFEGFEAQRIEDTRNGLITLDYAHRQFPYTGMHIQRSVYQSDASTRLATWLVTARLADGWDELRTALVPLCRSDYGTRVRSRRPFERRTRDRVQHYVCLWRRVRQPDPDPEDDD